MKINPSAYNIGKTTVERHAAKPAKEELQAQKLNTDQIQWSHQGVQLAETDQFVRSVAAKLEEPASAERLSDIRTAVENQSYYVPTEDLVDALMERWIGL